MRSRTWFAVSWLKDELRETRGHSLEFKLCFGLDEPGFCEIRQKRRHFNGHHGKQVQRAELSWG